MGRCGSLINMLYSNAEQTTKPEVGMGVTEIMYTDREPYEVIEVKDDRHITVRKYDYQRKDSNGMSEMQEYDYVSNPNNPTVNLFLTKKGKWRERIGKRELGCNVFLLGKAEKYYDYSF